MEAIRPFRWDIAGGAELGSLLPDGPPVAIPYAAEVMRCAARVLAQSGHGDLHFVGRSMDSMFDLLSGALAETSWADRVAILPVSLHRTRPQDLEPAAVAQVRVNLGASGLSPEQLARRSRPVVFVDFVDSGGTFESIFRLVRDWVEEAGAQWDVVRRKLRFIGVTIQTHTSPNTWRWQQHAEWVGELPRAAVRNVSMDPRVWRHLGNSQAKASLAFRPSLWFDEAVREPRRDGEALQGLAEAVAMYEHGRAGRVDLARLLAKEHGFREPWLRSLALELR